jgi:hypothetical protein
MRNFEMQEAEYDALDINLGISAGKKELILSDPTTASLWFYVNQDEGLSSTLRLQERHSSHQDKRSIIRNDRLLPMLNLRAKFDEVKENPDSLIDSKALGQ